MVEYSAQKSILITGGTSGLGLELVKLFLNNGYYVIATGRQLLNLQGFDDKFKLIQVDFSNLGQVASTIKRICKNYDPDIIINNAGVLSPPDYTATPDGFEYTIQVNFLSHLLLNEIILEKFNNKTPLRIAAITSRVYTMGDLDLTIHSGVSNYNPLKAYASSKLYLTLMCQFLPARYQAINLTCFSFDPGTFSSGIYRMQKKWFRGMYRIASPFMRSPGEVAKILAGILVNEEVENGIIRNIRNKSIPIPLIAEQEKEAFRKACYEIIDPFLK